jgi:hypothetical protein
MGWFQLAVVALSFMRELLKYLNHLEERNLKPSEKAEKIGEFKEALKAAKKEGNTSALEKMFADLIPSRGDAPGVSDDK